MKNKNFIIAVSTLLLCFIIVFIVFYSKNVHAQNRVSDLTSKVNELEDKVNELDKKLEDAVKEKEDPVFR